MFFKPTKTWNRPKGQNWQAYNDQPIRHQKFTIPIPCHNSDVPTLPLPDLDRPRHPPAIITELPIYIDTPEEMSNLTLIVSLYSSHMKQPVPVATDVGAWTTSHVKRWEYYWSDAMFQQQFGKECLNSLGWFSIPSHREGFRTRTASPPLHLINAGAGICTTGDGGHSNNQAVDTPTIRPRWEERGHSPLEIIATGKDNLYCG